MAKSEAVMLAHVFDEKKHSLAGCFLSEKLDGVRAIWDGGVSRGIACKWVPYANTEKDHLKVEPPVATGLWSRTMKPIQAPAWFLDKLPKFPLDGELYGGHGRWQTTQSIVSRDEPTDDWHLIEYKIFDSPSWEALFQSRSVKVRNDYEFRIEGLNWVLQRAKDSGVPKHWSLEYVLRWLRKRISSEGQISLLYQIDLPFNVPLAHNKTLEFARSVVEAGGEGAIVRKRISVWTPERSWDILKVKPESDSEGTVVGYWSGKETDKGSKLLGMMGALELEWQGAVFKISGFTDAERELPVLAGQWARANPGKRLPDEFASLTFPRGSIVSFKYRELSDGGTPKEARYLRKLGW